MSNLTQEELNSIAINTRYYYDIQRDRMALDGQLGKKKDGTLKKNTPDRDTALLSYLETRRADLIALEEGIVKEISPVIHKHPLWVHFLKNVKGCGEMLTAVIVSQFDIHKAPMVSNLVSFAGMAPGKDRRVKGKKCSYNQFLKSKLCGVLGSRFLMAKSVPYSGYYYDYKQRLENSDKLVEERIRIVDRKGEYKGKTVRTVKWRDAYPIHIHQAAVRKMVKEFLKDLYVAWRELEGLPIRDPYDKEYLGREHGDRAVAMGK